MVEENKDKPLVEEVQIETHLRDEGSEVVSVLNDELHELFESEDEAQVCPSLQLRTMLLNWKRRNNN